MLESFEQLEKDIEFFQKNIANSSDLLKQLEALIEILKKSKDEYAKSTVEVIRKIEESSQYMNKKNLGILNDQKINLESHTANYEQKINDSLRKLDLIPFRIQEKNELLINEINSSNLRLINNVESLPERIEKVHKRVIDTETEIFRETITTYVKELKSLSTSLKLFEDTLNTKRVEFEKKIDIIDFEKIQRNSELLLALQKRNQLFIIFGMSIIGLLIIGFKFFV
jgi:hypothetical protein